MRMISSLLRKTIEGYQNYFDYITVEKIISIQGIFVSDRTTNKLQFSRMQNKTYGHWLRYSTIPNVPTLFTQSSQANK